MKKIVSVLLILAAIVSVFSACAGKKDYPIDEQHEAYGRKALEIADAYLDGSLAVSDAFDQINELYDSRGSLPKSADKETDSYNSLLEGAVILLQAAFLQADANARGLLDEADVDVKILTNRNRIALVLGEASR